MGFPLSGAAGTRRRPMPSSTTASKAAIPPGASATSKPSSRRRQTAWRTPKPSPCRPTTWCQYSNAGGKRRAGRMSAIHPTAKYPYMPSPKRYHRLPSGPDWGVVGV